MTMIFGNMKVDVREVVESLEISVSHEDTEELYCHCPFHQDKNPSFNINKESGLWHCFAGCGGGNLVQLVQKMNDCNELKAMSYIASFGEDIDLSLIDDMPTRDSNKYYSEKELKRYREVLPEYLIDRGFDELTLRKWEVGYDTNNNLVVIPVRDESSRLRGVIYRRTDNERPKYKYSKNLQTSRLLFGLYMYPKENTYVLVEGSLDAIWLDKHGYRGIALLGSVMSREQEELIRQRVDKLILCLDNDRPGQEGQENIIQRLWPDVMLYTVELGPHKDIQEVSKEGIQEIMANKISMLERRITNVRGGSIQGLEEKDKLNGE